MPVRSRRYPVRYRTRRQYPGSFLTGTTFGTSDELDQDNDPKPHDISAIIESTSGRDLIQATHVRTQGQISLSITATAAAPTFTRALTGFGITWISEDHVTDSTGAAIVPSPFDDAYNWLWRKFRIINYAATSTTAGSDKDKWPYLINVNLKRRSRQPSPKHRLFFVTQLSANGVSNITNINAAWVLETGIVLD